VRGKIIIMLVATGLALLAGTALAASSKPFTLTAVPSAALANGVTTPGEHSPARRAAASRSAPRDQAESAQPRWTHRVRHRHRRHRRHHPSLVSPSPVASPTPAPAPTVTPTQTPTPVTPTPTPVTPTQTTKPGQYWYTVASGQTGQYSTLQPSANGGTYTPLSDAAAAALVTPEPERIPQNAAANATPGPANPASIPWGPWATSQLGKWGYLKYVDGHFTGTTDEILEWAAHKWGLDEDWVKAEATRESSWLQSAVGDNGESYGILQVKAAQSGPASANSGWGGYPYTQQSTALDADFLCAYLRAVYDGHKPVSWYGGQTVAQIAAVHGWQYVMWGAVGSWFSGQWGWSNAAGEGYISRVQASLASRTWLSMR
jgi:hypothetical protein